MNYYIIINNNDEVINLVTCTYERDDEGLIPISKEKSKIIDKLYDEHDRCQYTYSNGTVSQINLGEYVIPIAEYRAEKKEELIAFIKDNYFETMRTTDEIRTQWSNFKSNVASLGTKEEVDAAVASAITWLGL